MMADGGRQRKRQKWDVAAPAGQANPGGMPLNTAFASTFVPQGYQQPVPQMPQPAGPPSQDVIARAKMGAMNVLEKINQDLRLKGAVPMRGGFGQRGDEERIRREVTINDAPGPVRYKLTLRGTQDDIARRTGTVVVVRGRFLPQGVPNNGEEPPLYLKITPGVTASESESVQQQSVDAAAREVQHILSGGQPGTFQHPRQMPGPAMGGGPQQYAPPESYRGPHNIEGAPSNVGHGGQGMHGPGMGRGGMGYPGPSPQPGRGPAGGYQGGPQDHPAPGRGYAQVPPPVQANFQAPQAQIPGVPLYIGVEGTPEFPLAAKLRGPDGAYLKHIASVTSTQVVLKGVGSGNPGTDPLHIFITGGNQEGNDKAVGLAKNLIDTVRKEYQETYPYGPPKPQPTAQPNAYTQSGPQGAYGSQPTQGQYPPQGAGPPQSTPAYPPAAYPQPTAAYAQPAAAYAQPAAAYAQPAAAYAQPTATYAQPVQPANSPAPQGGYRQPGPQDRGPQSTPRAGYAQSSQPLPEPHPQAAYGQTSQSPSPSHPPSTFPKGGPQPQTQSQTPGEYPQPGGHGGVLQPPAGVAPYTQSGQPSPGVTPDAYSTPQAYPAPQAYPRQPQEAGYQQQPPADDPTHVQYPPPQGAGGYGQPAGGPGGGGYSQPAVQGAGYPQPQPQAQTYGHEARPQQGYQGYGQQPYVESSQGGNQPQPYPYPSQGGYAPNQAPQQQPGYHHQGGPPHHQGGPPQQNQYPGPQQQEPGAQQGQASVGYAGGGEGQQKEGRRRFREFKETPQPVSSVPAPYAQQQMRAPQNPGSMGPPPPRNPGQGAMGPPPPRPRQNPGQGGSENPNGSIVSGSLAGLVDYD